MKVNKLIIYSLLAALFISCDSELEIDPRQREDATVTLTTEKGITDVLNGAYALAASGNAYGGRISISADLLAQNSTSGTELRWNGTFAQFRQMHRKQILVDNSIIRDIWGRQYEIINAANTVIDNIDKVADPVKQTKMIAEAQFLRSLAYFDLVRFFAKPYVAGQTNSQLGVVIRDKAITDFSQDVSKERSTVEEVYALIIADLNKAYTDLPANNSFYANKFAAKALLARVYLQMQNYPAARDAANDVIANSGASLMASYKEAFNHDLNQAEDLFAIQITNQTGTNDMITFYASGAFGGRNGDVNIGNPYLNKFDDVNDERRNFNYINNTGNTRRLTSKYTNQFGDVPVIRLAEMFLIRAEANIQAGTTVGDTPLNDINRLRTRAKASVFSSVTLATILRERELELGMEGFGIHDIKRTFGSVSSSLPWNSDKLVFPIPLRETDTNTKITQNPGY